MKWYTSEPRKDCPIVIYFESGILGSCFCSVQYDKSSTVKEKQDIWRELFGYSYWSQSDILAWTTFEELKKDFQNSK